MTYQNDPNRDFNRPIDPRPIDPREAWGTGPMLLGGLGVLAFILALTFMLSDRNPTVASRDPNRPAVTTTTPATNPPAVRETTGSGATTIPANPGGTTPQRDPNQPTR